MQHSCLPHGHPLSPWALLTLCTIPCTKCHIRAVKLLSTITQSSWCVLICFGYVCLSGICLSVLRTILDKSYVSVLPWGWMSLYISENKASLCFCLVRTVHEADSISSPDSDRVFSTAPFTCSWAGSPWSVGFVWALCAIFRQANLVCFLGVVRTRISSTRMSGQRVITGIGQVIILTCVCIVANFILVTVLLRNRYFPM